MSELGLFPLPMVLLPTEQMPLHIFEERYRAMTRDVLAGSRFMAVSLIAPGQRETDDKPAVQRVAGVGEIMMAPVSVCQKVSTMGQRSLPIMR